MVTLKPFQAIFVTPHGNWALVDFNEEGYSEDGDEYASHDEAAKNFHPEMPLLWGIYNKDKSELSLFATRDAKAPLIILNEFFA